MASAPHARAAAGKPLDSTQTYACVVWEVWVVYDGQTGASHCACSQPGNILCCLLWGQPHETFPKLSFLFLLLGHWVVSDSLQSHGPRYARPPCPPPTPRACSNSCPSSRWCHPAISSSVVRFSSRLQSSPASGSFPMSQLFASGGQRTGASASASVLPKNIQGWFPLQLTDLISLQSKGHSRVFSNTTVQKHQLLDAQPSPWPNSHIRTWLLEKP